ncbi:MAG: hypothetical protein LBC97_04980 [Bifidobacteriaceae bacterium]|nr:hypothetical protein [Bifidobacteriaceae bacterium]
MTTYDPQCEGSRGWYLHEAAVLTGWAESIEADVVDRFAACAPDGWRFDHLADILVQFALDGSGSSRQALWAGYSRLMSRYARVVRRDSWWRSVSTLESLALDLVRVGGWDAARKAVSDFGEGLAAWRSQAEHARWLYFPDWFDSAIREQFGDAKVNAYLEDHSSPGLRAYGDTAATARTKPWRTGAHSQQPTIEELAALVDQARRGDINPRRLRSVGMQIVRHRSPTYTEEVARLGLAESDPTIKAEVLWAFRAWSFPLPDDDLASLVDTANDELRQVVRSILGQRPAGWKRRHALDLLKDREHVDEALELLQASYLPEDESAVGAAIRRASLRRDAGHAAYDRVIDLLKPDDRPVTTGVLEYVYRQTPCSICRANAVNLMRDKHALSDGIVEECLLDAYDAIRDVAAQIMTGRSG